MSHPPPHLHASYPAPGGAPPQFAPPTGPPPSQPSFPAAHGGTHASYPSPPLGGHASQAPFGGYPSQAPQPGAGAVVAQLQNISGNFEGVAYRIDHRDSNSVLSVNLPPGGIVKAKPGAMVTMSGTVQIKGGFKKKISLGAALSGGELSESSFTGPGEVLLAPEIWGDIFAINIQPNGAPWMVGKDAYLAATTNVSLSTKSQGLKKALFSGEGLLVHQASGSGLLFVQSLGAIVERQLGAGDELIVDNGHLVAWTCGYKVERIKAGGFFSGSHTGEGLVCRFTGPGSILIQTRNPESLSGWITARMTTTTA